CGSESAGSRLGDTSRHRSPEMSHARGMALLSILSALATGCMGSSVFLVEESFDESEIAAMQEAADEWAERTDDRCHVTLVPEAEKLGSFDNRIQRVTSANDVRNDQNLHSEPVLHDWPVSGYHQGDAFGKDTILIVDNIKSRHVQFEACQVPGGDCWFEFIRYVTLHELGHYFGAPDLPSSTEAVMAAEIALHRRHLTDLDVSFCSR
ncbi:hypothetical protein ACFL5O_11595, partial [Myxococcota bacterium]